MLRQPKMLIRCLIVAFLVAVSAAQECIFSELVTRQEWGARAPLGTTPLTNPVSRVFIHHTNGSTCTTFTSCVSTVQDIQNYDMDTNEWEDIGYNFLVGEDGRAYEGRGWTTMGSHVSAYNDNSIGIAVMGNYTSRTPNNLALVGVRDLIACGVDDGHLTSSYILYGHRDGECTNCPGNAFYDEISTWRGFTGTRLPGACARKRYDATLLRT